jgi:putative DNA primase/helicase
MTDEIGKVRAILTAAEVVDLPDGLRGDEADAGPDADQNPDPHPDADPYDGMEPDFTPDGPPPAESGSVDPDRLRAASVLPINDLGNAQRFVVHFGTDVMFVPRVGWHVWDGRVWGIDPDMTATRRKAQRLSDLVLAEVPYLLLSGDKMAQIARERDLRDEIDTLRAQRDDDGKLPDEIEARVRRIEAELSSVEKLKTSLSKIRTAPRHLSVGRCRTFGPCPRPPDDQDHGGGL